MKLKLALAAGFLISVVLGACSPREPDERALEAEGPEYYVVDESLARIRSDFNAMQDKIRLVFIIGPSCGICLRGMDDLNESIVKSIQDDPRAHTLAIHVPTLGAEERHVAAAIPLLAGPRVTHYWDPAGTTGREFQEALDIPMYAWDLWFIYQPGAQWEEGALPPMPDYWEHQLPGLPDDRKLDADRFAVEATSRLDALPAASDIQVTEVQQRDAGVVPVAQPHGVMIAQNHRSRGGYHTIKRIESIRYEGTTEIGDSIYPLTLETRRPHYYTRRTGGAADQSTISWNGDELTGSGSAPRLPFDFLTEMLASYDFDGWMTEWKDKGYQLSRLGMKKVGDRLPWLLEVTLTNGRTWRIYVDSHTGDSFRNALLDSEGNERIRIDYADYREADGFRLPHRIQYFANGQPLATDRFSSIDVVVGPPSSDGAGT